MVDRYWLENWVVNRANRVLIFRMHIFNPNWSFHSDFELCDFLFTLVNHFYVLGAHSNGAWWWKDAQSWNLNGCVTKREISVQRLTEPRVLYIQPEVFHTAYSPKVCYLKIIQPLKQILQESACARGRKVWKFSTYNKASRRLGDGINDIYGRAWRSLFAKGCDVIALM